MQTDAGILDQSFDDTGTFLITAYTDGTVRWQRYDGGPEAILDGFPFVDRIDW